MTTSRTHNPTDALVGLILKTRRDMAELQNAPGRMTVARRQRIAEVSRYLGGLEDAASLVCSADQVGTLLDDLRKDDAR